MGVVNLAKGKVVGRFRIAGVNSEYGDLGEVTLRRGCEVGVTLKQTVLDELGLQNGLWRLKNNYPNPKEGDYVVAEVGEGRDTRHVRIKLGEAVPNG